MLELNLYDQVGGLLFPRKHQSLIHLHLQRIKTAPNRALASLNSSVGSIFGASGNEPRSKRLSQAEYNTTKRAFSRRGSLFEF